MSTDPTTPEPTEPELSVTTKIALIEGEQFSVPYDMPVAEIRENLHATYPGIRTATVAKGTLTIQGVRYETVEFAKQAGTKGADITPLLPLLGTRRLPLGTMPDFRSSRLLRRGSLTFGQALDLPLFDDHRPFHTREGVSLCQILDDIPAVASDSAVTVPGWSA